jgi:hypothetical protein
VNKHVLAAIIAHDEAETLLRIEEFYGAFALADDLGGHSTTAAAATAEATTAAAEATSASAATAAAEAIAATTEAAAAKAITAATITATTTAEAVTATEIAEVIFAKTVALVPAALPATPTIETHAVKIFPNSPLSFHPRTPGGRRANLAAQQVMPSQDRLL